MRRRDTIEIKQCAKLWAIYEITSEGLELVHQDVIISGKPMCEENQVAVPITKGHVVYTMAYDDFIKNAKFEFIKEDKNNAN